MSAQRRVQLAMWIQWQQFLALVTHHNIYFEIKENKWKTLFETAFAFTKENYYNFLFTSKEN